ncbi:MAG: hypothetical protein ABI083_06775 [Lapillicoccus sp.]
MTRLLSIPARHPYVDAVRPAAVLPIWSNRTRGWEPDPFLRPEVVAAHAPEIDLVHLHFGFDDLDRPGVRRWLAALDAAGLPLVFTAHDLRNPHHRNRARHDEAVEEMVSAASAVVTLTAGAARDLELRHGVAPRVLAHPSLVDPRPTAEVRTEPGLVALHLKSLRRNVVDPIPLVAAAAAGARDAGGRLRVDLHPDVATEAFLTALGRTPAVEVVVHERFSDDALHHYLRRAHVTVLPYRWGTHSGWLELAKDLGTRVVAPSCGHYAEQWADVVTYVNDEDHGLHPESLRAAVATALGTPAPAPADRVHRLQEAGVVRRQHGELYDEVRARLGPREHP